MTHVRPTVLGSVAKSRTRPFTLTDRSGHGSLMLSQVGMIYEECTQVFKSLLSDYVRPTGPGTVVSSRTAAMGHECSVFPSKIVEMGSFDGRLALDRVGLEPQAGTGEHSPPGPLAGQPLR